MSTELEKSAESTTSIVVGAALNAVKDSPDIKEAGGNLAKAALTVSKTVNNLLLPLAALNYGVERAKAYFETDFKADMVAKLSKIKSEDIVEPKASVAGPALSGLAFTHDEPDLKELFLELICSAMDRKTSEYAHPAYAEMIKQMTAFEARLARGVLANPELPIIQVRLQSNNGSDFNVVNNNVVPNEGLTAEVATDRRTSPGLENLARLGLIIIEYQNLIVSGNSYAWQDGHPYVVNARSNSHRSSEQDVVLEKGIVARTDLGFQFANVVGCFQNHFVSVKPSNIDPSSSFKPFSSID
jgi:hypothetical protein